ncbi:cytochrome P450 family protein [Actinomycetospora termitidis]|uniref:Cytochrome P450 n=1 Tax=Actinomycetospora termitidis TaxID=3053470 RepID=A0ABT7M3I9_9PSEU|nr:cytochrome P450 [Actinomycetospora sp. Odt1-22]MDL5154572.1 cytochrome P450 [Actinomycetospora sp. Odt1-22]
MTDLATGPVFTDDYWADPYGTLSRLREIAPVREVDLPDGGSTWLVTRYADVRAAFVDPRLAKDFRSTMPPEQRPAEPLIPGPAGHMLLLNDPPVHTRLRKLVVSTFTVRRIAALRPAIEQIATSLLDQAEQAAEIDLVADYAVPLPMAVICELLGVPIDDRDAFARWSNTMIDSSPQEEKHQAQTSLTAYLSELVDAKRDAPDDALLSALIRASEDGDALSHDEIVAMGMILLIAGHETTANLITNSVHAVLRDDELRERVLAAESLTPMVEEFLRWTSPVANAPLRFATEDLELGGVTVPRGGVVTLSVAAANRDPERFDAPELHDADRDLTGHVAFGHGIHFCLGASLARLEAEVALTALFDRFPRLAPAVPLDEIVYRHSMLIHALAALPVRLAPE